MPGDTNETHEPFVTSCGEGSDNTVRREGLFPLVGLDQIMELNQIDLATPMRSSDSFNSRRAPSAVRSPVFVARKTSSR